ncbi:MAG: sugar transferase [Ilumatobacter sp.]|nr:MAG: sugar transferase [Ilumatobacter sp.]
MRRFVDVVLAATAGIVLAPVVAAVALLVRRAHGSPVLFRQQRAGKDAEPISVPKFRTMTDERGADGELLPDEDRLTPLGRRLRSSSLDELPQLWSVLTGDMSLIGPRPLPMAYVDRYSPDQRHRLDARPGITGWAQVNGRNALSWPEKLALDVWYVEHASPRVDVEILFRTIGSLVRRDDVSADGHATMPEFMGET